MKKLTLALAVGCATLGAVPALVPEAAAQTRTEQRRWHDAQVRFDRERQIYETERQRYEVARTHASYRRQGGYNGGYNGGHNGGYNGGYSNNSNSSYDQYATDYDAARYYRDDPRYSERVLTRDDYVYRGSDGRYYCKRSDGTTGLIIGAAGGAVLGNVIDGGHNRAAGTLIGGALGALLGASIERSNSEVRCR